MPQLVPLLHYFDSIFHSALPCNFLVVVFVLAVSVLSYYCPSNCFHYLFLLVHLNTVEVWRLLSIDICWCVWPISLLCCYFFDHTCSYFEIVKWLKLLHLLWYVLMIDSNLLHIDHCSALAKSFLWIPCFLVCFSSLFLSWIICPLLHAFDH